MEKTTLFDYTKPKPNRRIICLDMNSYFASVEQQDHPNLRGKPLIVTGEGKRSIVIAASREAKEYGITTAMKISDAYRLCPFVNQIHGDGDKYAAIQDEILAILERHFLFIEIASIDEVYIDPKGTIEWKVLEKECKAIKEEFREELGEVLTCSIGISINKLMAKFASNMKKPDGLIILSWEKLQEILPKTNVSKISGIGRRTSDHLHRLGIYTCGDIIQFPKEILLREFKEHEALFLYHAAQGIDENDVVFSPPEQKSFSHEMTLEKDLTSLSYCEDIIFSLLNHALFRMRKKGRKAKSVGIYLRFNDFSNTYKHKTLGGYTDNIMSLFSSAKEVLHELPLPLPIRQVGVVLSNTIASEVLPENIFGKEKIDIIQDTIYTLNQKYGELTIAPSSIYHSKKHIRKIHGFFYKR